MFKYINFLLLAILLLIFSCDEELKPVIEGCTIETACNYNADATDDDDSCIIGEGCNKWCIGDEGEPQEFDCSLECGGDRVEDECGICDNDSSNDCVQDCANDWGGSKEEDVCGVCGGTGIPFGKCDCDDNVEDCLGVCGGDATPEECSECESLIFDCAGVCDGSAEEDCDGVCGGSLVYDECGVCGGDGIDGGACDCDGNVADCDGECGGSAVVDECGECGGDVVDADECSGYGCMDETACNYNELATLNCDDCCETIDCDGICGGSLVNDECGVCGGAGPAENYNCDGQCIVNIDCAGDCGGSLVTDDCSVCGGDNDCIGCNDWYMENFICDDTEATDKCCVEDDNNNDNRCKINGTGNNCEFSPYCQEEYEMECDLDGNYCDYDGAAVGDPCSISEGSFTEGEGLCRKVCDPWLSDCFNKACDVLGEYCDYEGAEVGTPCSTSEGSFTEGEGLCILDLSDDVNNSTGYIMYYNTGCEDGTDDCCTEPACNEPFTLSLEFIDASTLQVNYLSTEAIGGFQFDVDGATVTGASGGAAADAVFEIFPSGSTVLALSFTGATIPAGSGILTNLNVDTGVSTELCLQNVVISDPLSNEINSCPEYWQITCIPIP